MSEQFEKVVNLYPPSEKDVRNKQDHSVQRQYPAGLDLLPLAKLCPQLGKVIPAKGSKPEGPKLTC
jgi:hypothetical protein